MVLKFSVTAKLAGRQCYSTDSLSQLKWTGGSTTVLLFCIRVK